VNALEDESPQVSASAAKAIGRIGEKNPAVILALIGAMREKHVVMEAATAITSLLRPPDTVSPGWGRGFGAAGVLSNSNERTPTKRFSGGWGDTALLSALMGTLNDTGSDVAVRKAAVQMLGRIAPIERAVPLLVSVLEAENPEVARSAAEALGEIGPEARMAVPALLTATRRRELSMVVPEALKKIG
jgi:HEAT repeat protein